MYALLNHLYLYLLVSVQFSHSVMSDSLQPHEPQHARPPCPLPTSRIYPASRPSSQWCHPAISSSVVPFSCPQFLPASESFPMSQLFTWGGQSTGVSALASFLPKKSQGWSSEWTGWILVLWKNQLYINICIYLYKYIHMQLSWINTLKQYILMHYEWSNEFLYPLQVPNRVGWCHCHFHLPGTK